MGVMTVVLLERMIDLLGPSFAEEVKGATTRLMGEQAQPKLAMPASPVRCQALCGMQERERGRE
jgi:hypothetical protein